MHRAVCSVGLTLLTASASAQPVLRVAAPVWATLSEPERAAVQRRFLVDVSPAESAGVIVDNQGIDQSTPGNQAGSALGHAYGSAAYVDRAISSGSYSARSHLGASLLGGLLGAALDQKPVSQYRFRYAVRLLDGNIRYYDIVSYEPFRHPPGVCVLTPSVTLSPDQLLCSQTPANFRATYLRSPEVPTTFLAPVTPPAAASMPATAPTGAIVGAPEGTGSGDVLVNCKPNSLPVVRTTAAKCRMIQGVQLDD